MKQITAVERPKKTTLPEGKHSLTEVETRALIEHSRKLVRDGLVSHIWAVLSVAAACYNIRKFELYSTMGYKSFAEAVEHEFGFVKRHGERYAMIGEQLAAALGGGSITQRMIQERMERDVWESRLGFRQIHTLARTSDGITRLLDAKNENDLEDLFGDLRTGAQAIRDELDSRPQTPLKAALSKRYDEHRPPTQTDLNMLFNAITRQLEEVNSKFLPKLAQACKSLSDDNGYIDSKKFPKKAQRMWNALTEMHTGLSYVARFWPDMKREADRVIALVESMPPDMANDPDNIRAEIERARQARQGKMPSIPKNLPADLRRKAQEEAPMSKEDIDAFLARNAPLPSGEVVVGNGIRIPNPADVLPEDFDEGL